MLDHPLRLAVGSHEAGSGKGCAMNLISWENGDTTITDLPDCVDPMLARIAQRVNDSICDHRDGDLLCPACSVEVLTLAHRTVGTSAHGLSPLDLRRVWVRVAADQARQVAHLNTDPRVETAIVTAEAWAETPTAAAANAANAANAAAAANANAAAAAANAAYAAAAAAAYAAKAANAAYADAANAAAAANYAAYVAANVAYAANAAIGACPTFAHRAIDKFLEFAGLAATPAPAPEVVDAAVHQMLTH